MTTLTIAIVTVFCVGYLFIAVESLTKVNKAAIALLMFVATWTLLMLSPESYLPTAVGGSMLIIGSAAGVVVMGLEKITFGWYMKHISWIAFVGYVAGIMVYWSEKMFVL